MEIFQIYDGRKSFWQWDLNQRLIVTDDVCSEVHFCNSTDDCSLVCLVYEENGKRMVNVPNILLQTPKVINVFSYVKSDDGSYTRYSSAFSVKARTKPEDYVYTETEVLIWEALEKKIPTKLSQLNIDVEVGTKDFNALENRPTKLSDLENDLSVEWEAISNKPFYDNTQIFVEWDGDVEGTDSVDIDGIQLYRIPNSSYISPDDFSEVNINFIFNNGTEEILTGEELNFILFQDGLYMDGVGIMFVVPYDNFIMSDDVDSPVFPRQGIYTISKDVLGAYIKSITKTNLKEIDKKFIPIKSVNSKPFDDNGDVDVGLFLIKETSTGVVDKTNDEIINAIKDHRIVMLEGKSSNNTKKHYVLLDWTYDSSGNPIPPFYLYSMSLYGDYFSTKTRRASVIDGGVSYTDDKSDQLFDLYIKKPLTGNVNDIIVVSSVSNGVPSGFSTKTLGSMAYVLTLTDEEFASGIIEQKSNYLLQALREPKNAYLKYENIFYNIVSYSNVTYPDSTPNIGTFTVTVIIGTEIKQFTCTNYQVLN